MGKYIDLTDKIFGRLTVVKRAYKAAPGDYFWECKCSCGSIKIARGHTLRKGELRSCGCLQKEQLSSRNTTHGRSGDYLFHLFHRIKRRCFDRSHKDYYLYGGRGITMFPAWADDCVEFILHVVNVLGERPTPKHSLDRINNNAGYVPGNIRWATNTEQTNNQRSNVFITYAGKTLRPKEWAEELGIPVQVIYSRRSRGWSEERVISAPMRRKA
jgi:hypothetical protein